MSRVTTDPGDPRLGRGVDTAPAPQHEVYLVLSEEERAKGFVRHVRQTYKHSKCQTVTTMSLAIAETYAREPGFYGATFCCHCQQHLPVNEFTWDSDGTVVGS